MTKAILALILAPIAALALLVIVFIKVVKGRGNREWNKHRK